MAPIDPYDDLPDAEDDVRDSDDDDFNPTEAPAEETSSSSDEDDAPGASVKGKRKRKAPADDGLDSGDEVTIQAARKRKAKKPKGAKEDEEDLLFSDGEGGEGGLVKTRAQRRVELKERKPLARTEGATIDVDALWAQMLAAPLKPPSHTPTHQADKAEVQGAGAGAIAPGEVEKEEEERVTITKVYTFAGQNTTEEKQISPSLLDQHLEDGWRAAVATADKTVAEEDEAGVKDDAPKIRRPLRRPSRYDPNPTGFVRALPPEHQLAWPRKLGTGAPVAAGQEYVPASGAAKAARPAKAQKINVVDKSRMDWTGFVNKEGIAEELDTHGKTKEAYLGRMNFLAGVEAKQEEERKRMKIVTATAT